MVCKQLVFLTWIVLVSNTVANGHTIEELKQSIGGEISESLTKITKAYEQTPDGVIREQLHAKQHEMALDAQRATTKLKCIELLQKIPALERKAQMLEKEGKLDQAEEIHLLIDKSKALATVACPAPSKQ